MTIDGAYIKYLLYYIVYIINTMYCSYILSSIYIIQHIWRYMNLLK